MFGSDDKKDQADNSAQDLAGAVQAMSNNPPANDAPQNAFAADPATPAANATAPVAQPAPAPAAEPAAAPAPAEATPDLTAAPAAEQAPQAPAEAPAATDTTDNNPASTDAVLSPSITSSDGGLTPHSGEADDLLDIKQNALEQLKPLVDHLDQVPEEKFDALMMMIRASDDHALIQPAYEAAQKITDDTKRAEALLDVVNEINYLTSNQQ